METKAEENRVTHASRSQAAVQRGRRTSRSVRYLFDAWPEIVARMRGAESRILLLDFDGTLVGLRRRPDDVRLSGRAKKILQQLVGIEKLSVAIVSGRAFRTIEALIGVDGIGYVGLHGAEWNGKSIILSKAARRAIGNAKKAAQTELRTLRGIWIEEKGLSFAVHYRGARRASVEAADRILRRIVTPMQGTLRILNGDKVWEVLPREIPGKGAAVRELLAESPAGTVAMYFGDDETDEEAFAALPGHVTVKVGSGLKTRASYRVSGPAEVLQFLTRLEKQLR
ncbi:MAG: trehalose-phosphatase [Candidatus Acidiferrales bacterium]